MTAGGRYALSFVGLAAALGGAQAATAAGWREVRSPHFVVVGDAPEAKAREVALDLERIREVLVRLTDGRVNPTRPVRVFACRDASFRTIAPWYWEGNRILPTGMFSEGYDQHQILLRTDTTLEHRASTVYHEYVHAALRQNSRSLPLWVQEGLAELFETPQPAGGQVEVGRLDRAALDELRKHGLLPMERLVVVDYTSPDWRDDKRRWFINAQAGLLVHFLLFGPEAPPDSRAALVRLLVQPAGEAMAFPALADPHALDRPLHTYLQTVQRMSRSRVLTLDEVPTPLSVRPVPEPEELALMGDWLVRTGRSEGEPLLAAALRADPGLAMAHEALGRLKYWHGRRPAAVASLGRAIGIAPSSFSAWFWLGLASPRTSATKEAALRRAVELAPASAIARERLAEHLRERGRNLDEAVALARSAVALEPGVWDHRLTLEAALVAAGHNDEAAEIGAALEREALSDPGLLWWLALAYQRTGRSAKADPLLAQALERHPDDPFVLRARAMYLSDEKRYDEAERLFRAALQARPSSSDLMNSLGYMNAERGVKLEEALKLIDEALKASPTNPYYLDSRGWALFRLGRMEEAARCLERSLEGEEHPVSLEHLGDVLQSLGRTSEAQDAWRRAMEHDDAKDDLRARVRIKLEARISPAPQEP